MRKTFSLILSAIMILSLFTVGAFAAEGTAINSAEDFKNMAKDGTYYLAADITVSETYTETFTGTLDGNGKTVTVSAPMFKQMNGTVKNLTTTGKIEITGSLGDVMKESAQLAVTYAKVHAEEYGITPDKFKNTDLHIHAPEGAVPKDGPSAGVTLTTALVSCLSGIPVRGDVAMTGEITLHGNVLPIGGLREKSMAAFREGISTVLIPRDNASDLYEVDAEVKEKVRFIPVGTLSEVLKHALVRPGRTPARAVRGVPQATSLIANDKPAEGHKEPAAVM